MTCSPDPLGARATLDTARGRGRPSHRPRRQGVRLRKLARLGGKDPLLLGVKAVIAKTYECIHRSNLVGMGILPLQFSGDAGARSLGLDGTEVYSVRGVVRLRPGA
jgi:hypothetical protein